MVQRLHQKNAVFDSDEHGIEDEQRQPERQTAVLAANQFHRAELIDLANSSESCDIGGTAEDAPRQTDKEDRRGADVEVPGDRRPAELKEDRRAVSEPERCDRHDERGAEIVRVAARDEIRQGAADDGLLDEVIFGSCDQCDSDDENGKAIHLSSLLLVSGQEP